MSEALVSFLVEQLGSIIFQQVEQNVRLIMNVKKEVINLTLNLKTIQSVLADAEKRQVKEANVRRWLNNVKEVSYEIDDVVDEWSIEILKQQIEKQGDNAIVIVPKKKVCFSIAFQCLCNDQVTQIIFRYDIAVRVKELNEKLALLHEQQKFYKFLKNETEFEQPERLKSFSIVDESETFGRDCERNILVSQLVSENSEERKKPLVISIVGMGGMGKTTLAQLAYNDEKVKNCFHTRIWVCVSEPFAKIPVAKAILEGLKVTVPNSNELETFVQLISDSIKGKKFLLVLDDVWDSNHRKWEPFLATLHSGASGSRILVTTRIAQVASAMGTTSDQTIYIKELGEEACQSLFYHIAFFDGERKESKKFEYIGNEIVKRCKGLPLAVKTLGSLMRSKKTVQQWVDVLNSKIWELEVVEDEIFQSLLLSYHDLEPQSKRCLLYCAIFPKDYVIFKDQLIELWMSQGYLEGGNKEKTTVGQRCFENLVTRFFFQVIKEDFKGNIVSCQMRNIVHDFVQYLTKDEWFSMVVKGANERMELPGDEVRHLSLMFAPKGPFPISSLNCKSLRTLTAFESKLTSIGIELISQSKSLRTLNLSENSILEVPKEIGGLIHLRYLDLSKNDELKELPDSLSDLYNLQTLVLVECRGLVRLPMAMGKLINLMHLNVGGCNKLRYPRTGIAFIASLKCLRTLNLSHNIINEVPKEIGELIHLIYINLSYNEVLKELPKAVCDLYNLETLVLVGCRGLKKLPNAMGKLTSLIHLYVWDCDKLRYLPKGIASLKSLEALDCFYVCEGDDEALKLGHLGIMDRLPGRLRINRLGSNAKDDASEIEKAQLGNKEHLSHLGVRFHEGYEEQRKGDEEIVKALQPHQNLKSLSIWNCHGTAKSLHWIRPLHKLREVNLEGWQFCELLPPLGKLPSLEILEIQWMDNVKKVGVEFLGIEEEVSEILFPRLERLSFRFMPNWEEWEGIVKDSSPEIKIMPKLSTLQIWYCPELKALPDFLYKIEELHTLTIGYCSILEREYEKGVGKEWHNISHIPNLTIG